MADIIPFEPGPLIKPGVAVSEDLAALAFADSYGGKLAYCHDHGKWFEYDGHIWSICRTPVAFHYARELARFLSRTSPSGAQMQKARFAASVESFARADPVFRRTSDFWDKDIWLLGTPAGTVDLKTGKLREPDQADNITKSTAIAPEIVDDCPVWDNFLRQATGDDPGMIRFLQQISGYALTGDISEQSLFFIYGDGGNGKGTFLNTIQSIMGAYAKPASMDTFAAQKHSKHETELARLRGARLVTSSETEANTAWAESRIKQVTGGDVIAARFMRQDFFEYLPQFTLIIMGNFKPALRTVDEAMRRRFNIIPFVIKPPHKDTKLEEKLRAEWPGILRWMINGCLDWQANGLVRPKSVLEATNDYFDEQNTMQQWLEQECRVEMGNTHLFEKTNALFNSWKAYAKANSLEAGDSKSFKTSMERLGFPYDRDAKSRFFRFVELNAPMQMDGGF